MHGHGNETLKLFEQMCEGVKPDDINFVCLLSACSHAGLVDEGMCCYASMFTVYMISPKSEHYSCMVDLLGRAGKLHEAENMIKLMPGKPYVPAWRACLVLAKFMVMWRWENVLLNNFLNWSLKMQWIVLLSNIYAAAGNRHLCENVELKRQERGVENQTGRTWIEVKNEVHSFIAGDQDHPQMIEIHAELQRLSGLMHDVGYMPDTKFVLHNEEEEEKVFQLCHHSVKLAIALGLINTAPGTPLRIIKNLWVCEDCHTSANFISKIVGRAIMVRDANHFQHFQDGVCSCLDYW
jgi:pentatricopeptide repeat protein